MPLPFDIRDDTIVDNDHLATNLEYLDEQGSVTFTTISDSETVVGLATGQSTEIYVPHTGTEFALCEYPVVAAPLGVLVRIVAHGSTGETNVATDKTGFVMEVTNADYASYGDITLNWTRTGIV